MPNATLMRQLETDLERATGLALADSYVLAQPAGAGGAEAIVLRGRPSGR